MTLAVPLLFACRRVTQRAVWLLAALDAKQGTLFVCVGDDRSSVLAGLVGRAGRDFVVSSRRTVIARVRIHRSDSGSR